MRGPLAQYGPGFHGELVDQGYAGSSAGRQVGLMSQVSEWMLETGLRPCELTPEAVDRFLALRRAQGRKRGISPAATAPLMCYLRRLSAAPEPAPSVPAIAGLDRVLGEYRRYLVKERGLAPGTIRGLPARGPLVSVRAVGSRRRLDSEGANSCRGLRVRRSSGAGAADRLGQVRRRGDAGPSALPARRWQDQQTARPGRAGGGQLAPQLAAQGTRSEPSRSPSRQL